MKRIIFVAVALLFASQGHCAGLWGNSGGAAGTSTENTWSALQTFTGGISVDNVGLNMNGTESNFLWDTGVNYTDHVRTAPEVDGSAGATLTAAQVSGTIITNYGQAAGDVALTLPTAAAGYNFLAVVYTAQSNKWGVRAGTNDKIYLVASDGATVAEGSDNGYARMTAAVKGQSFACWTFKTGASSWDWMCKSGATVGSTFAAN